MAAQPGIIPSDAKFQLLIEAYSFSFIDGLEFLSADSMILSPPTSKVDIYLKTFDVGLRLTLTYI